MFALLLSHAAAVYAGEARFWKAFWLWLVLGNILILAFWFAFSVIMTSAIPSMGLDYPHSYKVFIQKHAAVFEILTGFPYFAWSTLAVLKCASNTSGKLSSYLGFFAVFCYSFSASIVLYAILQMAIVLLPKHATEFKTQFTERSHYVV